MSAVAVNDAVTAQTCFPVVDHFTTSDLSLVVLVTAAVRQPVADYGADGGTGSRRSDTAAAFTNLRAEHPTGDAADQWPGQ